jgi:hypothetical protein
MKDKKNKSVSERFIYNEESEKGLKIIRKGSKKNKKHKGDDANDIKDDNPEEK